MNRGDHEAVLASLIEAGRVLNASLDPTQTLDAFGELATRDLADVCEVRLEGAEPAVYLAPGPVIALAEETSPSHTIETTLVAREHPLGKVKLTRVRRRQPFQEFDRLYAEDLTQRAAVALDNARLHRAAQEANRMKDEFLSTVSHELRSPLNAILGWSRMLTHGIDETQRAQAIRIIEKNARHQTRLVDDLLDTSHMQSRKVRLTLRATDVTKVVDAAVQALQPAMDLKRMQLRVATSAASTRIMADPDRLQQMVWNLLSNAIKFSPPGASITIEVARALSNIQLRVRDEGQGIDPKFMPYVFDRFTQADGSIGRAQGGLGLGLAITRHLAELHGGEIEARSEGVGRGSEFVVTLPVGEELGVDPISEHASEPKGGPGIGATGQSQNVRRSGP